MHGPTAPSLPRLLGRGAAGRCPHCGLGRLFEGFLKVTPRCPACGLGFSEHDAGDGPAVAGSFLVGAVVVGLALVLEATAAPPLWVHAALWGPLAVLGSLGILRPLKGMLVAAQYRYRSVEKRIENGRF